MLCLQHKDFTFQLCFSRFPVQGMQADAVDFTGVTLVTQVPQGEGPAAQQGLAMSHVLVAAQASPPQPSLHPY